MTLVTRMLERYQVTRAAVDQGEHVGGSIPLVGWVSAQSVCVNVRQSPGSANHYP